MSAYLPEWADLWFMVTIAVPVVLPSLGAAFLRILPGSSVKIMPTVSDGQLGWVSNYRVFVVSLGLTVCAAANFTALHHKVLELHESTQHSKCSETSQAHAPPLPNMYPLLNCKGP